MLIPSYTDTHTNTTTYIMSDYDTQLAALNRTVRFADPDPSLTPLTRLPLGRQLEIRNRMQFICIRPEMRFYAKLPGLSILTYGDLALLMEEKGWQYSDEQRCWMDEECFMHFRMLERASFSAWPASRDKATTGLERGYRNAWGAIPSGWFNLMALREKEEDEDGPAVEEVVEGGEEVVEGGGESEEDMNFGLVFGPMF